MSDDTKRVGLGKVIYSVDEAKSEEKPSEEQIDSAEVAEANKESFPASDPPGFAGSSSESS